MKTPLATRLAAVLCCCITVLLTGKAHAEEAHTLPPLTWMDCELNFKHLTVNDGMLSNAIRSLCQDRYGRLWIGSGRGIDIYDGHRFTARKINDVNVTVYSLCEGPDCMWIGTARGLFYLDYATDSIHAFRHKTRQSEMPTRQVLSIVYDRKGNLWFTSHGQGIFCLMRGSNALKSYTLPGDDKRACSLLADKDGQIWSFRTGGTDCLDRYNHRADRFEAYPLTLGGQPLPTRGRALAQDGKGTIYLGDIGGRLYAFTPGSHEARMVDIGEGFASINSIATTDTTDIIVSSEAGLALANTATGQFRRIVSDSQQPGSLSDQLALPLFIDREQTLWVGTFFGGLNYTHMEFSNFVAYPPRPSFDIAGKFVSSFAEDRHGNIWLGCEDGGLSVFDPATRTVVRRPKDDKAKNVQSIHIYGDRLIIGTYRNGFLVENLEQHTTHHYPQLTDTLDRYLENSVRTVFTDSMGTTWLGTYNRICSYVPGTGKVIVHQDDTSPVGHICQDKQGNVWFATKHGGVWRHNPRSGEWRNFNGAEEKDNDFYSANTIFCDSHGRIWMGMTQGLYRYNPEEERFSLESEELRSLDILDILDFWGQLWMTTSVGVVHYFPDSDRKTQFFHSGSNGLQNTDFVPGALFLSSDSTFYAGTSDGFVTFNPLDMQYNDVPPQIRFTGFSLYGRPAEYDSIHGYCPIIRTDTIVLQHDEDVLRVYFSAMSFVSPKDNHYRYFLEGFDRQWIEGPEFFATYTNLQPGTYRLHVQATNNDGVWAAEDAVLTLIIEPPYYWSNAAQAIYAIILAALLCLAAWAVWGRRK